MRRLRMTMLECKHSDKYDPDEDTAYCNRMREKIAPTACCDCPHWKARKEANK